MGMPGTSLGVVIVAAGSGTRFGAEDKVFHHVAGKPILQYSLDMFTRQPAVTCVVVVLGSHTLVQGRALIDSAAYRSTTVCQGGATRAGSVRAGLSALPPDIAMVAVHDAARPCVSADLFAEVLLAAWATGAAIPAVPVSDTVHKIDRDGHVTGTPDRSMLVGAQTPQIARLDWLIAAYGQDGPVTDEAGCLRSAGFPVHVVEGDPRNIKITRPIDLAIAEALLAQGPER
jgi:2-C-methyl-D-erythritol 4-phosphate cytidylyltransferase